MNDNLPQNGILYDDLVIRLHRQTHWDDSGQAPTDLQSTPWSGPNIFQLEVRQAPLPLQGGAFRADAERHLAEFQNRFTFEIAWRKFYNDSPGPDSSHGSEAPKPGLADLGAQLYNLLPASFHLVLPNLIQSTFERGRGIRLILEARAGDQADRLLSLPWELLFFETTRVYPARSLRLLVVRRLLDAVRQNPVSMRTPYNLIHVIADDPQKPIAKEVQQTEYESLAAAIGSGYYELVINPGSFEGLLAALQARRAQIVHFLGHGIPQTTADGATPLGGRGYLCFIDKSGQRQKVTGEHLQHLLSGMPGVQLIVLNACHGAFPAATNIALDLVYSGFPYVVAMQGEVSQEGARYFTQAFYSELQRGHPIDYAVAAGRFAIAAHLPGAIDWCLPVLYTSVGLAEKTPALKFIEEIEDWFRRPRLSHPIVNSALVLGGAHLAVGMQLLILRESYNLPTMGFMVATLGWLVLMPPLVTWWVLRSGGLPIPANWSRSTYYALLARMFSAATIGIGLPIFAVVWFNLILLIGLGAWQLLPLVAQTLLVVSLATGTLIVSYAQARSHGLGFITSAQVGDMPFEWRELVVALVGYLMLAIPLLLFYPTPALAKPPYVNLLIGAMSLLFAYFINRENERH